MMQENIKANKGSRKAKTTKKADRETSIARSKGGGRDVPRFTPEVQRWCILIALSLIVSVLLFPNMLTKPMTYNLGDVADRDIKASHDFLAVSRSLWASM